jgi:hypothetical protein
METADLPEELAWITRPLLGKGGRKRTGHAIASHQNNVADFAVLNTRMKFLERLRVVAT